ncbi:MAG TPA: hypothetical protein VN026_17155 [Bacteroidia bacterium]|jgi:hypothetical protein|nr:hypothetical protein [Bacteroidia bacterium]
MENKITIATFYAFGSKTQKAFIDKTDEEITEDLRHTCNTNNLLKLEYFTATLTETKIINEETVIAPHAKKGDED